MRCSKTVMFSQPRASWNERTRPSLEIASGGCWDMSPAVEPHLSGRARKQAGNTVEKSGLSSAVRTHRPSGDARVDVERCAIERMYPAEANSEIVDLQQ